MMTVGQLAQRAWILVGLLAVSACANAPIVDAKTDVLVYPITQDQARKVITDSLREVMPSRQPVPIANGYQTRFWFVVDNHRIRGYYYAAQGRRPDGTTATGYRFEVRHSGTMPITGTQRATELQRAIHRRARELATPMPVVN